jgi:zinc protease
MQLVHLYFTQLNNDTLNYRNVLKNEEQELANRAANPQSALQDSATIRFRDNNPRQQPFTLERLKNVSYEGIRKIYQERFGNANDFTFIFTGNINADSIRTFAKLYLASLPVQKSKPENYKNDGLTFWKGMQQCRFNKKMETPMAIMVQAWNGKYPYSVKNDAVSEAAGRVLDEMYLQTVREKYSLVYSINSDVTLLNDPNPIFLLETACPVKPEKCDSALLLVDEGMKNIADHGVGQEYLSKVKEQMLKIYENNLRENNFWQHLQEDKILQNGRDGYTGYKEALQSITSDDIQKFIRDIVIKQQNRMNLIMLPQ